MRISNRDNLVSIEKGSLYNLILIIFMAALSIFISMFLCVVCSADIGYRFPTLYDYEPYEDLSGDEWYFEAVKLCRQTGLLDYAGNRFNADSVMTYAECDKIARHLLEGLSETPVGAINPTYPLSPIYAPDNPINRESFVDMLTTVIEEDVFWGINSISKIPGSRYVDEYDTERIGDRILLLYRAGILVGDEHGYFSPMRPLTRAEAAVIIYRIVRPDKRLKFSERNFQNDRAITISRIDFDNNVNELFGREAYSLSFYGDSFYYQNYNTDNNGLNKYAVVSLSGAFVTPVLELDKYLAYYNLDIADGVTRFLDCEGMYHFYKNDGSNNGAELLPEKQIKEATPFWDGYAAVRFDGASGADVSIIDKNGSILETISNELPFDLISIYPEEGVILGWIETNEFDETRHPRPWGEYTANVMLDMSSNVVTNYEGSALICDYPGFTNGYALAARYLNNTENSDLEYIGSSTIDYIRTDGSWLEIKKVPYSEVHAITEKYMMVFDGNSNREKFIDYDFTEICVDSRIIGNVTFIKSNEDIVDYTATVSYEGNEVTQRIIRNIESGQILSINSPVMGLWSVCESYSQARYQFDSKNNMLVIIDIYGNALLTVPERDAYNGYMPSPIEVGGGFVYEIDGEYFHFSYSRELG